MKRLVNSHVLVVPVFLVLLAVIIYLPSYSIAFGQTATATPKPLPHWTYEGDDGPDQWGHLDNRFAVCSSGKAQSPINLTKAQKVALTDIQFNYKPSKLNIFNNGHTIQVNYDAGSSITYNEIDYQLIQFHFHHPSEHTVDGQSFDLELHLVHQSADGSLAVVGVLIKKGEKDIPAFATIFNNLPSQAGTPPATTSITVDASSLLPANHLYDTYVGSLTTPPCTEGVRWLVLTTPIELSEAQIEAFSKIFELNARPVQPLNTRDLLQDNTAGK